MNATRRDARRLIVFAITALCLGGILTWTLYLVRETLLLLYIAGLLAVGFSPAVRWVERIRGGGESRRNRIPRWVAILVLYIVFLTMVGGTLALILPPLVTQSRDLWSKLPAYSDSAQQWLIERHLIPHMYTWSEMLRSVPSPALALVGMLGLLSTALGSVGAIVTILVLPYYLLLEANVMQANFLRLFSHENRPLMARITRDVTLKVSAWLGGQLLLSSIIGVTTGIGLALLGVPYFYVLALCAAVGEVIPVVGPVLAAIPAILVALTVSVKAAVFVIAYFVVQQFLENHFIVPKVMQRQVGVSAVTVIAALLVGTELLGIVGALLAVPTAAIVQVVLNEFLSAREKADEPEPI